jgi:hypothetical protein
MSTADTTTSAPTLTDHAWALGSTGNHAPVEGILAWDGTTISFTLSPDAADAVLEWVEQRLVDHGLAERLRQGENVAIFAWATGTFTTSWPALFGGGAVELTGPAGDSWLVAMEHPSGGAVSPTVSLFSGRKKGHVWKRALAGAST